MLAKTYAVQPYEVGAKNRKKSLVLVIPTKIAEEHSISTSSILAIRSGVEKSAITFHIVNVPVADSS